MSRSDRFAALSKMTLTALNARTTARYNRCAGRHVASGEVVQRQYPGKMLELPVCRRCSCPYGFPPIKRWGEQPI
jgi:hypothetical protein